MESSKECERCWSSGVSLDNEIVLPKAPTMHVAGGGPFLVDASRTEDAMAVGWLFCIHGMAFCCWSGMCGRPDSLRGILWVGIFLGWVGRPDSLRGILWLGIFLGRVGRPDSLRGIFFCFGRPDSLLGMAPRTLDLGLSTFFLDLGLCDRL